MVKSHNTFLELDTYCSHAQVQAKGSSGNAGRGEEKMQARAPVDGSQKKTGEYPSEEGDVLSGRAVGLETAESV